jgi:predicted O-methyltransferase YrrM
MTPAGMRLVEYTLGFEKVARCRDAPASLAMRERLLLYSLVYSLAPQYVLEIGTFKGGSAYIISGALDDLDLGGKLITIDPAPEQIRIDWTTVQHNATSVRGYFPSDVRLVALPGDERFDFVFVDGSHETEAVVGDLRALPAIVNAGAYVLLHDAYKPSVAEAISTVVAEHTFTDCGMLGRVRNDTLPDDLYGGLRLLMRP